MFEGLTESTSDGYKPGIDEFLFVFVMMVRAGIGRLTLLDADRVQPSNINRQLCALHSTVGEEKVRVLGLRFKDINPELDLTVRAEFLEEHSAGVLLDSAKFDFIVDAIDTIAPK